MERTTVTVAKELFGNRFLGPNELKPMFERMCLNSVDDSSYIIPYTKEQLTKYAREGYILIFAIDKVDDTLININLFRNKFGIDPDNSEPCLYNQDWYISEDFIFKPIISGWHLIKKDIFEDSRAVMPKELIARDIKFPTAILCIYTFFAYYYAYNEKLWYYDFVWCSDTDHNGDRIYVGKYHDVDGVNKNGFSIHRHLALRSCYGAIGVK